MPGSLRTPNISTVPVKVTALQGLFDRQAIDDRAASSVDEPGALLHLADEFFVEQSLGLLMQGAVLRVSRAVDASADAKLTTVITSHCATRSSSLSTRRALRALAASCHQLKSTWRTHQAGGRCSQTIEALCSRSLAVAARLGIRYVHSRQCRPPFLRDRKRCEQSRRHSSRPR